MFSNIFYLPVRLRFKKTVLSPLSLYTEKELLSLFTRSDDAAFTEIYNRYWNKLFSVAANKLNNPAEAEEIVQDIFLDLWKRRMEFHITASLNAYLATAVKYKVINILTKRNQQLCFSKQVVINSSCADISTEQWLNFEELKERLGKLVAALPEKCRFVFQLSRNKGLSQKEIASQLGVSEKTVEAHLSKAIRTLRTQLKNFFIFLF